MNRSRRAWVAVVTAAALLASACGGDDDSSSIETEATEGSQPAPVSNPPATTAASGSGPAAAGGELAVGRGGSITGWSGDGCYTAATNQTLPMVYGTLLDWAPDGQGVVPGLVEEWTFDPAAPSYTLTLRDGLRFSDGSDLTSADVAFSVEQWKAGPINGGLFANIATAETPDDRTVVLQLAQADTFVEPLLSWCVSPVYPEDFGGKTPDEFFQAPIGAGPFMLSSWNNPGPSEEIVLDRNPNYWDAGLPLLDRIVYRSNPDPNQRVLAYRSGDLDVLEQVEYEVLPQLPEDELVYGANMGILLLLVNTARPPLDDVKVRQAIALAIDRDALTQLYGDRAEVATGILPNNVPFGGEPSSPWRYDLDEAKRLIAESSAAGGASLELLSDAGEAPMAQVIAAQLAEIGMDLTITTVDNGTLFARGGEGDFDLQINGNVATSPSALDPILATQVIGWYYSGMPVDLGAEQLAAARASEDDDERAQLVTEVQDLLVEQAGNIGLLTLDSTYAVKPGVTGF
ncbi:MAG: ABC transporter substrate-binding protein, partial [Actinobacteria bacterium]|nr:ABC transporter substrate-binding protein [Actinomycetota bacterium]